MQMIVITRTMNLNKTVMYKTVMIMEMLTRCHTIAKMNRYSHTIIRKGVTGST